MKKYLSIIIGAAAVVFIVLSGCTMLNAPEEGSGSLALNIEFAGNSNTSPGNDGKDYSPAQISTLDQVHCTITRSGSAVWDNDLTLSAGIFYANIELEAGTGYSAQVDCYQNSILAYSGVEYNITIVADSTSTYTIILNPTVPQTPSSLSASVTASSVDLTWVDNAVNEDSYNIERRETIGGSYYWLGSVSEDVTSYSDNTISPGVDYTYRVYATNITGNSGYSNEASGGTSSQYPAAPSDLDASAVSSTEISLTWTDNSSNEDGFRVERSDYSGGGYIEINTVGPGVTYYQDYGLQPLTKYYYRVCAYNAYGNSAYSNEDDEETLEPAAGYSRSFQLGNSALNIQMVWIPAGGFYQGAYSGEQDAEADEYPQHYVNINDGFWMGAYEVTQAQWEAIAGYWSFNFPGNPDYPAEMVSWNDITNSFLPTLNSQTTDGTWRLPSESEWEYACRAGTTTRFYWGDDPGYSDIWNQAWYFSNSGSTTHAVGTLWGNYWGLFDMSGNVNEWCEDYYHSDYYGAPDDGSAWLSPAGSERIIRGAWWGDLGYHCRSAARNKYDPDTREVFIGLRIVRSS